MDKKQVYFKHCPGAYAVTILILPWFRVHLWISINRLSNQNSCAVPSEAWTDQNKNLAIELAHNTGSKCIYIRNLILVPGQFKNSWLQIRLSIYLIFSHFSMRTYAEGTHWKSLSEVLLMSTHDMNNISTFWFIIEKVSYLKLWQPSKSSSNIASRANIF